MAKVVILKKDKTLAKRQKETKFASKLVSPLKASKSSVKKIKNKRNDATKKKTGASKKNGDKDEQKKKWKVIKPEKTNKTGVSDRETKRPCLSIAKNTKGHSPAARIRKVVTVHSDGPKVFNGNTSQTTRTPWVHKFDKSSQSMKHVSNGVPSNGAVSVSKSVIAKNKVIFGAMAMKEAPISHKKVPCAEQILKTSKCDVSKNNVIPNKALLKTGHDPTVTKKKNGVTKSFTKNDHSLIPKERNLPMLNHHKLPKICCRGIQKSLNKGIKPRLKTKAGEHLENQCRSSAAKFVLHKPLHLQTCKPLVIPKLLSSKSQKTENKKPKLQNNASKKLAAQEKVICMRVPPKHHPQRMASLNAMAKMRVICSTDRRVPVEVSIAEQPPNQSESSSGTKSKSRKIHVGIKKEIHEIKGHIIHSRINCIKFEESSVTEGTGNVRTFCSISQEQEQTVSKRSRGRPKSTSATNLFQKSKASDNDSKKCSKSKKHKVKNSIKRETKSTRIHKILTVEKTVKKSKKKEDCKSNKDIPNHKLDKKKVKLEATIRLRKTCTIQSVTTVSSHKNVNSLVSSCSRLGMTTNFERKKSVIRDQTREKKDLPDSFQPVLEGPCTVPLATNYLDHNFHSAPRAVIPLAHSQSCCKLLTTDRFNESRPVICNEGVPAHCHKEPYVYHRIAHSCGCCCSSSLVQSMCDNCALPKETNSCARSSCCRLNTVKCPCPCCRSSVSVEHDRCLNASTNFPTRCCACHNSAAHRKASCNCCHATVRTCSSVPLDQVPLDLSLGASTSVSAEKNVRQSKTFCQTLHHCQEHIRFQPCPHNCQYSHCVLAASPCASFCNLKDQEKTQPLQISVVHTRNSSEAVPILESISSFSRDEANLICQETSTVHNFASSSAKLEYSGAVRSNITKKRKFTHGWSWEGEPVEKMIALTNESIPAPKRCYPALRHKEGDIIKERDCVLLKSGPKDTDLPYVAKVAAFWENPDDGEMMMSLLWYYRPEHTDQGRRAGQKEDEVFASKHRDVNSVACIEDKCFVLTYNEYCRYRANLATLESNCVTRTALTVPGLASGYPRHYRLPTERVSPDMIFFCRHVYDFRQKRILKNPT